MTYLSSERLVRRRPRRVGSLRDALSPIDLAWCIANSVLPDRVIYYRRRHGTAR